MSQMFQRFKISCKVFIRAIATPEHPIVIFLDDLQWSDLESRTVLRSLVADLESKNILIIAACRSDDPLAKSATEAFNFKKGLDSDH
jgi:predicted ATPase